MQRSDSPTVVGIASLVVLTLAITVGWNYGVTEILGAYGLGDHNIDWLEGIFVFVFVRAILPHSE